MPVVWTSLGRETDLNDVQKEAWHTRLEELELEHEQVLETHFVIRYLLKSILNEVRSGSLHYAFLTPPAPLELNSSSLSPTEGSDCVASNAKSAALVAPTDECRLTMPNIAGEGPFHFNQNATPRMVLNLRDPGSATPSPRPKKLADTMAQYATTWGCTLQLKNGHQDELIRASQIKDPNLQFLYIASLIFSLKDEFALVCPADTAVAVPEHTEGHIKRFKISQVFGRILDDDRVKYQDLDAGEENLDELAEVDVEADYN
ncbi:hypothetical protein K435DRAFT_795733 [Dendrothele bispora CBS 962.96]|uniref:Uncharacterized protein n=1 Tax=Dendrothele bispora (strain CBS 962.96) TaxID=1314807 RepID=A0A4S8M8E9_DENBC|nr:hypothetical protein K435DRAFT_795733 [Dendrothele bispora CBS 962.96]